MKKAKLKDFPNIFSNPSVGEVPVCVEAELGEPSEWGDLTTFVVEYAPVAIHRVIPAVPGSFKKETK